MKPILETPRLALRELVDADLDFVAEMLADPDVMAHWTRPYMRDEAVEWIRSHQKRYADDGYGYWLALDRGTGRPVGQAGLLRQELDTGPEVGLGYMLHRPFWGRGLALEAARGCLGYAFETLRVPRVVVLIRPENIASLRVAARLGVLPERLMMYKGFEHLVFIAVSPATSDQAHSTAQAQGSAGPLRQAVRDLDGHGGVQTSDLKSQISDSRLSAHAPPTGPRREGPGIAPQKR